MKTEHSYALLLAVPIFLGLHYGLDWLTEPAPTSPTTFVEAPLLVEDAARTFSTEDLFYAIRMVETGDEPNPQDGDGLRAIGPYQIHRGYHIDAIVPGGYQRCREREYAESVIKGYMRRYAPGRLKDDMTLVDAEVVARIHNGGPKGYRKDATLDYWRRVRQFLLTK